MATITFDQVGLSAGVTDRARSDGLDTGAVVTITVSPGSGVMQFVDVPPGDSTSVASLAGGPTVWTFTPTAGVYGTWLVQYVVSGVTVRREFSVRTPVHGLRIPAFNEKASILATIANGASHIADSDDNEGGSYKGWYTSLRELYNDVENAQPNAHSASHKHGGADEVATATPGANAIPKANSGGKLVSGWTSLTQMTVTGPFTSNPTTNRLVLVDVSSGAVTINLPAGHSAGDTMVVKLTTAATNTVTIDPNGGETVDGASTLTLIRDYEWASLVSNGTNWYQIS